MIKTKTSATPTATLEDTVEPIQVSFSAGFVISATGQNPACSTGLGTVTGTFSGGTAPYQCKLDNGSFAGCTSPVTYNNVGAGSHTVTVMDSNTPTACQKTSNSVTITIPTAVTPSSSNTPILCNGGSSTVTVSASGGPPPFTREGETQRAAGAYSFPPHQSHTCRDAH